MLEILLGGMALGGVGYGTKEVFRKFVPKKNDKEMNKFKEFPDDSLWEDIWFYNNIKVKVDNDEVNDYIATPHLLGKCLTSNGARFMFRMPIGITTNKMETCKQEIKEKFNVYDVEVKHYKEDLAIVELIKFSTEEIVSEFKGSILNEDWVKLWDACKVKTGEREDGYKYPTLIDEKETEFGKDFTFQFPIGLSTFKVDKADITIKEFLSARNISIIPLSGNRMCISAVYKDLPTYVQYNNIPRKDRVGLEIVLGKSLTGYKRLDLLDSNHNVFVGGAVGSGKSVCINTIITDIAITYTPKEVEMWIVDLKVVEMNHFRRLKHVKRYGETVPDMMNMIDDLTEIMWERYDKMKELNVRKLSSYNELVEEEDRLPYIFFVVEEIYEFTSSKVATKGDDNYVERLAVLLSKCRSAGIIGCISTQRLVNTYIPRNISANLMNRICFKVSDSKESALLTDEKYDATSLKGKGHGCAIGKNIEEFQCFYLDEDKLEVTNLLKKHNLLKDKTEKGE